MIEIRKARVADAEAIANVYVETWRNTYAGTLPDEVLLGMSVARQMINWTRALGAGREIVLCAEDGQAGIVGMVSGGANRQRQSSYSAEVYTLYVLPDFHDQGIGERLLAAMFEEFVADGHSAAVIWVLYPNPARFFYETMGGKRIGDRDEKLWGTVLKEIGYGWDNLAHALANRPKPAARR